MKIFSPYIKYILGFFLTFLMLPRNVYALDYINASDCSGVISVSQLRSFYNLGNDVKLYSGHNGGYYYGEYANNATFSYESSYTKKYTISYRKNGQSYDKEITVLPPTISCPDPSLTVVFSGQPSGKGVDVQNKLTELNSGRSGFCSLKLGDIDYYSVQYTDYKTYNVTYYLNGSSTGCPAKVIVAKPLDCPSPAVSLTYSDEVGREEVLNSLVNLNNTRDGYMLLELDSNEPETFKPSNDPYTVKYYVNGSSNACTATITVNEPVANLSYCKKTGVYNVTYPTGYAAYYLSITSGSGDTPVWGKVPDEDGKFAFKNPLGESSTIHLGGKKTATSAVMSFKVNLTTISIETGSFSTPNMNSNGSYTLVDPIEISVLTEGVTTHEGSRKWYVFSATDFPKTKQPSSSDFPASPTKTVSESSYESDKTFTTSIEGCGQWVAVVDEKECCADTSLTFVPASFVINCPNYNLLVDNDEPVLLSLPTVTPESSVAWEVVSLKNGTNDVAYSISSLGVTASLPIGDSSIFYKTTFCENDYTKECPIFIVKKAQPCDK